MATQHHANVLITNDTDTVAHIQLFHRKGTSIQNGSWTVPPHGEAGPMAVEFETGWDADALLDWWSVIIAVEGGPAPGTYQNSGTVFFPHWKEHHLEGRDAGQTLHCAVSTSHFTITTASGRATNGMTRLRDFSKITNVFVLMLENHSFDNIFGQSGIPRITHAGPGDSNSYHGTRYAAGRPAPVVMPTDPGHEFTDVVEQLAGPGAAYPPGGAYPPITRSGFAANYATTTTEGPVPPAADIGQIMLGFDTPTQLPVLYQLATEFAVCDHWFSSLPGPTWPNRFFVHGASSAGLDHSPTAEEMAEWSLPGFGFTYPRGSLFGALSRAGLTWRIYHDDTDAYSDDPQIGAILGAIPQVAALQEVTLLDTHSLTRFAAELQEPYTVAYTFIEPNYGDVAGSYRGGSSQHPMDDVHGGEGLVKAVYEAIRNSPAWNTSLLLITYDEHGGFYDSVAPGPATPPGDGSSAALSKFGFTFSQLGVRVPAVAVSPWIPAGTVSHSGYDHSSVPATVERLFGLPALTARDKAANDLRPLLTAPEPRTDAPARLHDPAPPAPRPAAETAEAAGALGGGTPGGGALAARDREPIPQTGNLPGFLAIMLKTDAELSAGDDEREAARARHATVSTRGDARAYIAYVMAKARTAKAAAPQHPPR
jgi:phospholipase C